MLNQTAVNDLIARGQSVWPELDVAVIRNQLNHLLNNIYQRYQQLSHGPVPVHIHNLDRNHAAWADDRVLQQLHENTPVYPSLLNAEDDCVQVSVLLIWLNYF